MILISHRGNLNGPSSENENRPEYIDIAIELGFNVEIDVWYDGNDYFLGHDFPMYKISFEWLMKRKHVLWVHCKSVIALSKFYNLFIQGATLNYFWHETDTATLTSLGYIWAFPGKQPIDSSIAVMPEIENDSLQKCIGVCSDFISNYYNYG